MRLSYVSQSTIPSTSANSIHVMKMAQAFAKTGLAVSLSARRGEGAVEHAAIYEQYAVKPVFDLHLKERLNWPMQTNSYILAALWRARQGKATLIYTRLPRAAVLAELFGWRTVVELHHPGSYRALGAYLRLARRPLIVVITEALRAQVIADLNCDPDSVIVAPDGADPMPTNIQPALPPAASGRLRVGFLGHLYRGKGIEGHL